MSSYSESGTTSGGSVGGTAGGRAGGVLAGGSCFPPSLVACRLHAYIHSNIMSDESQYCVNIVYVHHPSISSFSIYTPGCTSPMQHVAHSITE